MPWPRSPNMTAKRKGKVTMVKTAGLTSRYRAMPYASTMDCYRGWGRWRLGLMAVGAVGEVDRWAVGRAGGEGSDERGVAGGSRAGGQCDRG
jgi:hypothetical protein